MRMLSSILGALFAWAWIYLGNETARRNQAICPKYPDGKGDPHL